MNRLYFRLNDLQQDEMKGHATNYVKLWCLTRLEW